MWFPTWIPWRRYESETETETEQKGASTTEYALLLALVVVVLISSLSSLGAALRSRLQDIITQLTTAGG